MLRLYESIPILNSGGGSAAGITWGAGVGAARTGVCSSGIVSPTVDEFAGTGWVETGGNSRARTSMGLDGSHLHRASMAPHSISRRTSEGGIAAGLRSVSSLVSALLFRLDKNGNGVGVLSMIGPNPPIITWGGVDGDMFDRKVTCDDKTNKGQRLKEWYNFEAAGGANWLFGEFEICCVCGFSERKREGGGIYLCLEIFFSLFPL